MQSKFDMPSMFATVIYTCLLGVVVFAIFSVIGTLSTRRWYEPAGTTRD